MPDPVLPQPDANFFICPRCKRTLPLSHKRDIGDKVHCTECDTELHPFKEEKKP